MGIKDQRDGGFQYSFLLCTYMCESEFVERQKDVLTQICKFVLG